MKIICINLILLTTLILLGGCVCVPTPVYYGSPEVIVGPPIVIIGPHPYYYHPYYYRGGYRR